AHQISAHQIRKAPPRARSRPYGRLRQGHHLRVLAFYEAAIGLPPGRTFV
ncbi:unnamed protein product, partial [Adineta ricciae]